MPRNRTDLHSLSPEDLIRVSSAIVDPTPEQTAAFQVYYQDCFGTALEAGEAMARLRHLAQLYVLLRGHERYALLKKHASTATMNPSKQPEDTL